MKEVRNPRRPLVFYYMIALIVLLVLNYIVLPFFAQRSIKSVSYSQFMNMTLEREIDKVQIENDQIIFTD